METSCWSTAVLRSSIPRTERPTSLLRIHRAGGRLSTTARSSTTVRFARGSNAQASPFRTQSDTEVVLLGFIHEGAIEFSSFCAECSRSSSSTGRHNDVFAARDPIGVKPFYYMAADGMFIACKRGTATSRVPRLFDRTSTPRAWSSSCPLGTTVGRRHADRGSTRNSCLGTPFKSVIAR